MTAATDTTRSPAEIVAAIKAQIEAVTLADDTTPAFQRVEKFDIDSLTDAFRLLLISDQRVCVIVVLNEQFENVLQNRKLLVKRMLPIALLISDRILGDRVKALWGDPADATQPGAFALARLALPAVTGQLLSFAGGKSGVTSTPQDIESIFLQDTDQQELPGRAAVKLELQIRGGTIEAALDPGPNL